MKLEKNWEKNVTWAGPRICRRDGLTSANAWRLGATGLLYATCCGLRATCRTQGPVVGRGPPPIPPSSFVHPAQKPPSSSSTPIILDSSDHTLFPRPPPSVATACALHQRCVATASPWSSATPDHPSKPRRNLFFCGAGKTHP
jgi:hypothetical protein